VNYDNVPYVPQPPPPPPPFLIDAQEVAAARERQREMLRVEIMMAENRVIRAVEEEEPEEAPVSSLSLTLIPLLLLSPLRFSIFVFFYNVQLLPAKPPARRRSRPWRDAAPSPPPESSSESESDDSEFSGDDDEEEGEDDELEGIEASDDFRIYSFFSPFPFTISSPCEISQIELHLIPSLLPPSPRLLPSSLCPLPTLHFYYFILFFIFLNFFLIVRREGRRLLGTSLVRARAHTERQEKEISHQNQIWQDCAQDCARLRFRGEIPIYFFPFLLGGIDYKKKKKKKR
jgi:hypothetical protein